MGVASDDRWMARAACAGMNAHGEATEIFFPGRNGDAAAALAICAVCTVRAECLEYALAHPETHGIWGGMSERARRRLKRSGGREVA